MESNHDFVSYKQAKILKKNNFNIRPNFGSQTSLYDKKGNHVFYTNYGVMGSGLNEGYIYAPLKTQLFKWLRDNYGVKVISVGGDDRVGYSYLLHLKDRIVIKRHEEIYKTYEEAEEACIDKLIKMIKKYGTL